MIIGGVLGVTRWEPEHTTDTEVVFGVLEVSTDVTELVWGLGSVAPIPDITGSGNTPPILPGVGEATGMGGIPLSH